MRFKLFLLVILVTPLFASLNFGDPQILAPKNVDGPEFVTAADLDNDGDLDIISASYNDDKVAWYWNNQFLNRFDPQTVIHDSAMGVRCLSVADFNLDGSLDIAAACADDKNILLLLSSIQLDSIVTTSETDSSDYYPLYGDTILFYDKPVFSPSDTIFANQIWLEWIDTADMDNDGDIDIVSVSAGDNKVCVYYNQPTDSIFFSDPKIINNDEQTQSPMSLAIADLNKDGFNDIIVASADNDRVCWFENTNSGTFNFHIIADSIDGVINIDISDFNNDNLPDILTSSFYSDVITWFENSTTSWIPHHLPSLGFAAMDALKSDSLYIDGPRSIQAVDLNDDSFVDILFSSVYENMIGYYLNSENGFDEKVNILSQDMDWVECVYAADLDGDSLAEVIAASYLDDIIVWYQNNTPVIHIDPVYAHNELKLLDNYPNPFNPYTQIQFELQTLEDITIQIYNIQGQQVTTLFDGVKRAGYHEILWDASQFSSGTYFICIKTKDTFQVQKCLLLK